MSNLACIGMGEDDAARAIEHAAEHAELEIEHRKEQHLLWRDDSGAAVAVHVESDAIVCVTPFFAAEQPTHWSVLAATESRDPKCRHCSGADCDLGGADGELATRAAVQWLHASPYARWLRAARGFELEVVAFGAEVRVCADSAALQRAMAEGGEPDPEAPGFADDFFIASGMFAGTADDGMLGRARAYFAGRIEAAERCENRVTGGAFHLLRVATLPGAINVVAASIDGEPEPGALALVEAWLVGRPTEPPPPEPPGLLSRLFGR